MKTVGADFEATGRTDGKTVAPSIKVPAKTQQEAQKHRLWSLPSLPLYRGLWLTDTETFKSTLSPDYVVLWLEEAEGGERWLRVKNGDSSLWLCPYEPRLLEDKMKSWGVGGRGRSPQQVERGPPAAAVQAWGKPWAWLPSVRSYWVPYPKDSAIMHM